MENFDVTIVGGGSAGLAALKHLSSLGKQSILLEAGKEVGSKNVQEEFCILKNQIMEKFTMSRTFMEKVFSQNLLTND
jgi:flavin-dependent dehydrogenase